MPTVPTGWLQGTSKTFVARALRCGRPPTRGRRVHGAVRCRKGEVILRVIYPTGYRLHPDSLEVVCDPLPHPGQPLRRRLQASAIDEERRAVRVIVPEREDGETFEHYVARCLHEALLARRLGELELPAVPALEPVLVEVNETDSPAGRAQQARFRLGPRLFELFPLSAQKPGENWMDDPAMQLAAPLWGIAIHTPPEGTRSLRQTWEAPGLRLRDHRASALLHAAETVAWVYARAKEGNLLCLPADPSRIYLAGTKVVWVDPAYRVASLLEVHAEWAEVQGQRPDDGKVSRARGREVSPWRFLPARLEAELAQYAGEVLRAEREVPSRIADDVALQAFGSFLRECLDRQSGFGWIGFERELYRGLQGVAGRALKGLGEGYSGWDDLLADLESLSDPDKRAPTPIRVGVFLDYANVFTSLQGWSIDMGKVARAFGDPLSGRRVKRRRAAVVESPGKPKDRIRRQLEQWGFVVDRIYSDSGRADQKDDERLMQRIRAFASELDEIVILTGDSDYLPVVDELLRSNKRVKLVHFGNVSREYGPRGGVEVVNGLRKFWYWIEPDRAMTEEP